LASLFAPLMFARLHNHSPSKTMAKTNHGLVCFGKVFKNMHSC